MMRRSKTATHDRQADFVMRGSGAWGWQRSSRQTGCRNRGTRRFQKLPSRRRVRFNARSHCAGCYRSGWSFAPELETRFFIIHIQPAYDVLKVVICCPRISFVNFTVWVDQANDRNLTNRNGSVHLWKPHRFSVEWFQMFLGQVTNKAVIGC